MHASGGERPEEVAARVGADGFLGLFVSCATLLRGPRTGGLDVPLHRLFLEDPRGQRALELRPFEGLSSCQPVLRVPLLDRQLKLRRGRLLSIYYRREHIR